MSRDSQGQKYGFCPDVLPVAITSCNASGKSNFTTCGHLHTPTQKKIKYEIRRLRLNSKIILPYNRGGAQLFESWRNAWTLIKILYNFVRHNEGGCLWKKFKKCLIVTKTHLSNAIFAATLPTKKWNTNQNANKNRTQRNWKKISLLPCRKMLPNAHRWPLPTRTPPARKRHHPPPSQRKPEASQRHPEGHQMHQGVGITFFQNKGSENWAFKSEYPLVFLRFFFGF